MVTRFFSRPQLKLNGPLFKHFTSKIVVPKEARGYSEFLIVFIVFSVFSKLQETDFGLFPHGVTFFRNLFFHIYPQG